MSCKVVNHRNNSIVKLKWFYHENSDCFFPAKYNENFDNETVFIWEIGDFEIGTVDELRKLLIKMNHYLKDALNLEEMINNDVEQY
jgi:hypothetical protein